MTAEYPFVRREDVLGELRAALEHAASGRGQLVTLIGPAGAGKTRTAEEAAAHADAFRIRWTCCPPHTAGRAFRPWSRLLRTRNRARGSEGRQDTMPRTTKAEAELKVDDPVIEGRYAEIGPYTVAYGSMKQDMDPAPLFRGLPDDRCQCPHWGQVLSGRIVFRYADHDEVFHAGDAYYGAPGHLPPVRRSPSRRTAGAPRRDEYRSTVSVAG
ncbi:AAA family ATPase [Streptomyces sp. NPDC088921]|uniref:AAA family ATPase n=1 Tax=unclassified Streptomyces TaxID=2593676 RepID=UPI00342C4F62